MRFESLLIANRGEIATRIIRTAKRMGLRTVAVYSDADKNALHAEMADMAVHIGPAPARESYLSIDAILRAAATSGARAIHPGYGFLSENADFADAVAKAGLIFVGPPPNAMRAMGSKSESKRLMAKAGVPLVPGYHGTDQSNAAIEREAGRIGFPVLIKASAGGGGKGMRIVTQQSELEPAIASARREAKASFGDDTLLVEKYLSRPRHVEIQVFADIQGNAVYLFERDCSLQRRHQKVIEEAPAPGLSPQLRSRMGEAAVAAAKAVGYLGAGTVEFLLDEDGGFYFIEMNTRLQVEHPVTEMITGLDLVEWQLRVAMGEALPSSQDQLSINGHAFEARIYAEDPSRDFLPATGRLLHWHPPAQSPHVRVDSGVRTGCEIGIYYDPMLAKLIVWDENRAKALARLQSALADFEVAGLVTNLDFLSNVATHPAFAETAVDTGFLDRERDALTPMATQAPETILAVAAIGVMLSRQEETKAQAKMSGDPYSPWFLASGWRMNDDNHHDLIFKNGEHDQKVTVHYRKQGWQIDLPSGASISANAQRQDDGSLMADLDGYRMSARLVREQQRLTLFAQGKSYHLDLFDPMSLAAGREAQGGSLTAPMPGKVTAVHVKPGDAVLLGQPLMILEAMKMEHTIKAPIDGVVAAVHFAPGDQASDGDVLIAFAQEE
ncbi:Acetyl-/propionyl-coenzyme A carboxylase alpha chain (Includes: Biotin carboxylase; Biotin carboxyl carrier protein) [Rhodospirillaceae bacterium LM-1]|nr:Acetyl-/propionyl-coenzyme A carboxylase alpha chain (Includes: Biotin carboxylase; Biotin carboxyl carrier protein) [Rhodospirillaceae bacterium LM-1]